VTSSEREKTFTVRSEDKNINGNVIQRNIPYITENKVLKV